MKSDLRFKFPCRRWRSSSSLSLVLISFFLSTKGFKFNCNNADSASRRRTAITYKSSISNEFEIEYVPIVNKNKIHNPVNVVSADEASLKLQQSTTRKKLEQLSRAEAVNALQDLITNFRTEQMNIKSSNKDEQRFGIKDFVDLSKRFLFSKLPEFAVEAYLLYNAASNSSNYKDADAAFASPALLVTTIRAHLAMGNINDALLFLQTIRFREIRFESHYNSLLITDLCHYCGIAGLEAALSLRNYMKVLGQKLTPNASLALLESVSTNHRTTKKIGSDQYIPLNVAEEHWYAALRREMRDKNLDTFLPNPKISTEIAGFPFDSSCAMQIAEEIYEDACCEKYSVKGKYNACLISAAFGSIISGGRNNKVTSVSDSVFSSNLLGRLAYATAISVAEKHSMNWDFSTANALLEECLLCNYKSGAGKMLDLMKNEGLWARTSTYNLLLRYYRANRDPVGAIRLLTSVRNSKTVKPDAITYALTAQVCSWSGTMINKASEIIDAATKERNVDWKNSELLNAKLLVAHAHGTGIGGVIDIEKELNLAKRMGINPNEDIFIDLIEACAERKDLPRAFELYDKMYEELHRRQSRLMPNPGAISHLGNLKKSSDNFSSSFPPPSQAIHVAMLLACAKNDDYSSALKVLNDLRNAEWNNKALSGLSSKKKSPLLRNSLLYGPTFETTPPQATAYCYEIVINSCIQNGKISLALDTFNLAESDSNVEVTQAMYASLIRGFGKKLELSNALGVWQELCNRFRTPNRSSYEAIIDCCTIHPQGLQHASELISEMKSSGYSLAADHYSALIRGFGDAKNMQASLGVFSESPGGYLSGLSMEVSEDIFGALLAACMRSGEAAGAAEAVSILKSHGIRPPRQLVNYLKIESDSEFEIYDRIFGMRNIPPPVPPKKKNLKNKYKYGSKGSAFTENETAEVYYEDFTDMVIAKMEALECAEYEDLKNAKLPEKPRSDKVQYVEILSREERISDFNKKKAGKERSIARKKDKLTENKLSESNSINHK